MTNERDWFSDDVFATGLPPIEAIYGEDDLELWFGALPFNLMLSTGTHATVSRPATGSSNFAEASLEPTESSKDANISITSAELSECAGTTYSKGQDVSSSSEGTCQSSLPLSSCVLIRITQIACFRLGPNLQTGISPGLATSRVSSKLYVPSYA
jgi:hypothetical protein